MFLCLLHVQHFRISQPNLNGVVGSRIIVLSLHQVELLVSLFEELDRLQIRAHLGLNSSLLLDHVSHLQLLFDCGYGLLPQAHVLLSNLVKHPVLA